MKTILFCIAICFSFSISDQDVSPVEWQEDINYFHDQMIKRHKNAFHHVSREEFDTDVNKLLAEAADLPDYQVIVRLLQITAKIGDGHTVVHLPPTFRLYPIAMQWFGDSLYVTAVKAGYERVLGARVLKIGGKSIAEVRPLVASVVSQNENKWFDMATGAALIMRPEVLATLGIADYNKAKFTFEGEAGSELESDIVPVETGNIRWISATKNMPLFRQRQADPFWFTYLKEIDAVFLSFKNYENLAKDTKELFRFVDSTKASRLIVDLRFNGGGDFKKGRRLLISPIQSHPLINQKGNLFVITGRRTFSAAMVNSIDFKKMTNAIIIGEPPGERPNSYSENDEMKLPNSKLVISYSTEYYKFLDEDVAAFEPDVLIDPDWESHKNGNDRVMDWIIQRCTH